MDERLLNDLLECSVCLERLDTSSKVLPCQHTFCKKCLEEIVHTHKELRCPECRVLVGIGIDDLPPNVLLMRILEGMRNIPHRTTTVNRSYQYETGTTNPLEPVVSSFPYHSRYRSKSASRQASVVPDLNQPYAIAKCNCITSEPGDLNFKRGDVILLRRKIEHNWYQGECNGVLGVFPLSYVQVMIPLPSHHTPQCKALYNFSKCHEDDEGCLHFSKGDIITVLRRIDENWAEGKLDDRIGIFPISFVEMNYLARNLMKTSFNTSLGSSRDAPPTPSEESVPLISKDGSNFVSNSAVKNSSELLISSLSPSSSSSSTSTATTSPTSSSESTSPSSPSTPPSSVQLAQSAAVKRHSFTLGAQPPPYHAPPAVHRHSVEIFKPDDSITGPTETNSESTNQRCQLELQNTQSKPVQTGYASQLEGTPTRGIHHRKRISVNEQSDMNREHSSYNLAVKQVNGHAISNLQRQSSLRVSKNSSLHSDSVHHPALPAMYIAIYPYKPQKTDELELKIGSVYTVIERCQDGWFKGTSHPNQKCGVFPGNYVTPVKSLPVFQAHLRGMMHDSPSRIKMRLNPEVRAPAPAPTIKSNPISAATTVNPSNLNTSVLAPPELPARSVSPISQTSASQRVSATIWHVPTMESHETTAPSLKSRIKNGANDSEVNVSTNNSFQKPFDGKPSPKLNDKGKDKKERNSVSLMRRLTSIKKSRSPPPISSFSIDNPGFEDGGSSVFVPVAHARSDSCPSQLSYNTPSHTATSTNNHTSIVGGSQRVKHKQRSSLQNQFSRAFENNPVTSSSNLKSNKEEKPVISHRKSSSLDTTLYDERQSHKTKPVDPPPRERFRCITPYPPNSEFELELRIGDIIYVHKKRDDGWYKGTLQRNGRTGLFPASFVEAV